MRYLKSILVILLVSVSAWAQAVTKPASAPSLLFVMSAQSATITRAPSGHYQLLLKQVYPQVLWFSDRPERQSGMVSVHDFFKKWQQGFKSDPPNVAMIHAGMLSQHGHAHPAAIELSKPKAVQDGYLFDMRGLKGGKIQPGHYYFVSLLIDNMGASSFFANGIMVGDHR